MNTKIIILALCVILFAHSVSVQAQTSTRIPRIGYITGSSPPTDTTPDLNAEAFRQGLRDLGYVEGENILVEYRYVEGKTERTPSLVAELLQLKVDILVVITAPGIQEAKLATETTPIVMVTTRDPVAMGFVESLARPGGNLTGLTRFTRELSGKRLELFKEAVPTLSRVGVLSVADPVAIKEYEPAARTLKIALQSLDMRSLSLI